MPRYKVNTRVSITWYVEAESLDEAWEQGEALGCRSVEEYGFDRGPGSVIELHPGEPEWEEALSE
jgi:hypothetical protein